VQDTYVRALSVLPDWLGREPAWLFSVLRNIAIDRLRRKTVGIGTRGCRIAAPKGSSELLMEVRVRM